MSRVQAAQVGLPEFNQRYKGWEEEKRAQWTIARWVVWQEYNLNPYIKPANKPRTPADILRFDNEDTSVSSVRPEDCHIEEREAAILEEIYNSIKNGQHR